MIDELEIEPEEAVAPTADEPRGSISLSQWLPQGFNLPALLAFLPDPSLKRKLDDAADLVMAIDVTAEGGLDKADRGLAALRQAINDVKSPFEEPAKLANQLHKRITGTRADYIKRAEDAVRLLGQRVYAERRRQEAEALAAQAEVQERADAEVRASMARVADDAESRGASQEIVNALQAAAESATAPPVLRPVSPALQHSTLVEKWIGRLKGTSTGSNAPNPKMADLTKAEQASVRTLLRAIAAGKVPLTFVEINWGEINRRANADRSTFVVPGLEAFDAGSVRGKR